MHVNIQALLIAYPCSECKCGISMTRDEAEIHLKVYGFLKGYTRWVAHREFLYSSASASNSNEKPNGPNRESNVSDDMHGLVHDALGIIQDDRFLVDRTDCENHLV
ncbi:hypothetical protein ACH5RR_029179 [Cinchona calisaya]|uniref:Transposase-associated domain-containing protein n=1 Tax=Cinchona calisaya TaxID=153742 RepID=A0ABD2YW59_9GENT